MEIDKVGMHTLWLAFEGEMESPNRWAIHESRCEFGCKRNEKRCGHWGIG